MSLKYDIFYLEKSISTMKEGVKGLETHINRMRNTDRRGSKKRSKNFTELPFLLNGTKTNVTFVWLQPFPTCSGVCDGTIRIENLPITFPGITVFSPGSAKAPYNF